MQASSPILPACYRRLETVNPPQSPVVWASIATAAIPASMACEVHLNSWLVEQGFMVLKNGIHSDGLFEGVDWGSTSAYAVGLTILYMKLVAWK
ncbi:MAG: hypothetical protein WCR46_19760 [Deltaproteobacteria bacterium]|jgi:predicted AlkP superfamily phosphohydrolase/phosphomutase